MLHPAQGGYLVLHAEVTANLQVRQEAERSQAIVEANHHHTARRQLRAIGGVFRSRSAQIAPAVYPDHHRAASVVERATPVHRRPTRPHIQVQAIFTFFRNARVKRSPDRLQTLRAKLCRRSHIRPWLRRLRRRPAQWADWRHGVRNTEELCHAVFDEAFDQPLLDTDLQRGLHGSSYACSGVSSAFTNALM